MPLAVSWRSCRRLLSGVRSARGPVVGHWNAWFRPVAGLRLNGGRCCRCWPGAITPPREEIYRALRTKRVAIATVYRTLRLFAKLGVVRQLRARDGCVRYELVGPSHAHFVCLSCGRVFDADQEDVRGGGFRGRGFVVTDSEICLFGYCPACTRKEGVAAHG
ncbi:MAG: transcriptional repressor [Bacillota bacterium]